MKKIILDFDSYIKMNEAEETVDPAVKTTPAPAEAKSETGNDVVLSTTDQILDLFFQAYSALVTKIGDYKDAISDLTSIAEADDKTKVFLSTINKVAGLVDEKYRDAALDMQQAAKKLQQAYNDLIKTESGAKEVEKINDKIYKKILAYQASLKEVVTKIKHIDISKISESYNTEEQSHLFEAQLFEKNTFKNEREELIKKITPIYAHITNLAANSPLPTLKTKCIDLAKTLKSYLTSLANEDEWENKKRKIRKEDLAKIAEYVNNIPEELNKIQSEALIKLGIDNKVQGSIQSAIQLINKAMNTLSQTEETKIETAGTEKTNTENKEADGKKGKTDLATEEIKSGNKDSKNISRKGPNMEKIKAIQEKMNSLLTDNEKIDADGLYGGKTEEAIKKIASRYSAIVPELKKLDGSSMTPMFIKFVTKFKDKQSKIADLFK